MPEICKSGLARDWLDAVSQEHRDREQARSYSFLRQLAGSTHQKPLNCLFPTLYVALPKTTEKHGEAL